jgi:hypothetical protein
MSTRTSLTPHDRRRLAVAAPCDDDTVIRAYAALPVRQLSRLRLERAAAELGLPPPPAAAQVQP